MSSLAPISCRPPCEWPYRIAGYGPPAPAGRVRNARTLPTPSSSSSRRSNT